MACAQDGEWPSQWSTGMRCAPIVVVVIASRCTGTAAISYPSRAGTKLDLLRLAHSKSIGMTPHMLFHAKSLEKSMTAALSLVVDSSSGYSVNAGMWTMPISRLLRENFVLSDGVDHGVCHGRGCAGLSEGILAV